MVKFGFYFIEFILNTFSLIVLSSSLFTKRVLDEPSFKLNTFNLIISMYSLQQLIYHNMYSKYRLLLGAPCELDIVRKMFMSIKTNLILL